MGLSQRTPTSWYERSSMVGKRTPTPSDVCGGVCFLEFQTSRGPGHSVVLVASDVVGACSAGSLRAWAARSLRQEAFCSARSPLGLAPFGCAGVPLLAAPREHELCPRTRILAEAPTHSCSLRRGRAIEITGPQDAARPSVPCLPAGAPGTFCSQVRSQIEPANFTKDAKIRGNEAKRHEN